MKTINEAAIYIMKSLPEDTVMTVESVEEQLFESILERTESLIEAKDIAMLESKQDDLLFVEQYLAHKIPNYYTMLTDLVAEYLSSYVDLS